MGATTAVGSAVVAIVTEASLIMSGLKTDIKRTKSPRPQSQEMAFFICPSIIQPSWRRKIRDRCDEEHMFSLSKPLGSYRDNLLQPGPLPDAAFGSIESSHILNPIQ
jgi:hypothetical protein